MHKYTILEFASAHGCAGTEHLYAEELGSGMGRDYARGHARVTRDEPKRQKAHDG